MNFITYLVYALFAGSVVMLFWLIRLRLKPSAPPPVVTKEGGPQPGDISPDQVEHDDPRAREAIAECFNTGKVVMRNFPEETSIYEEPAAVRAELKKLQGYYDEIVKFIGHDGVIKEIKELREQLAQEKQENLDHAEDWAMSGINGQSLLGRALMLSDQNRKLKSELGELKLLLDKHDKGVVIALPKSRKHAEDMYTLAVYHLKMHGVNPETPPSS